MVNPDSIRVGDLVTVRLRSTHATIESIPSGPVVIHRVVRALRIGGEPAFLTKGDRRATFDPLVLGCEVRGRITQPGGAALARISYLHGMAYHRLRCLRYGRLNRLRVRIQARGWLPRFRRGS